MARIHVIIDDDLHRRAKSAAALEGVTLRDFVERALAEATLKAEKKPRKR